MRAKFFFITAWPSLISTGQWPSTGMGQDAVLGQEAIRQRDEEGAADAMREHLMFVAFRA